MQICTAHIDTRINSLIESAKPMHSLIPHVLSPLPSLPLLFLPFSCQILIATPSAEKGINRDALASALNIIHFFLFGMNDDPSIGADLGDLDVIKDFRSAPQLPEKLMSEIQASSNLVAEKLLTVASAAAAEERSGVVHNALKTITFLLIDPLEASKLISNPQSRTLLATVLRSGSKKVREMSADFAIQVGASQPVVFSWLLAEMETLDPSDSVCSDIFRALGSLLVLLSDVKGKGAINMHELGALLSSRLMSYPRGKHRQEERQVRSSDDTMSPHHNHLIFLSTNFF